MFNLFTSYKWAFQVGGVILAIAAITFGYHLFKNHQQDLGYQRAVGEYAAKARIAEQEARARELALFKKIGEARDEAIVREHEISKLNGDLSVTTKRLHNTISTYNRDLSSASRDAVNKYAQTLGNVLGECTERYREMGKNADGERSDKMMLMDAWPK